MSSPNAHTTTPRDRFADRSAVVTGGASGIGLATARRLLAEGAHVLIGDYNTEAAEAAVARLESEGFRGRVTWRRVDVAEEVDVEALMEAGQALTGRLDVVFNNAGIGGAIGPIVETDVAHWDATFAVLTRGVFLGVKHAARRMIGTGGGVIVNTASIAGVAGGVLPTPYSAAKAAVISFTRNAANELAEHRIRVNAVCPGVIFTPLMHNGREDAAEAVVRQIQPWPDRGEPEHVADAVAFLASDEAAFITGEALAVDGGYLANGLLRVHPLPGAKAKADYAGITYGLTGRPREVRRLD
ncbi:MAG: SDR family oxidoreductase [Phenylobacterium sp.]|uniref:SDR family NAD(P)-dependent oxidoreductase n=1 Tax=Phenylobacterium sp. TaxID=1871053 RepID=UPI001A55DA42|nr:SDR family NAD(P)-dependent oxidoreductase [Phenylobacterium sp.]MBL8772411.1 SDR family oxidoreductase [Phenylobacterium sp.]